MIKRVFVLRPNYINKLPKKYKKCRIQKISSFKYKLIIDNRTYIICKPKDYHEEYYLGVQIIRFIGCSNHFKFIKGKSSFRRYMDRVSRLIN